MAVPADTPVTVPVVLFTVATSVLLLAQVAPAVAVLNVVVPPTHTFGLPVIAAGNGFTVIVCVCVVPSGDEYVTTEVPAAEEIPVNTPVVISMVPAAGLLADHVPPDGEQCSAVVMPSHTVNTPVIGPGNATTVTIAVIRQPVGSV